MSECEFYIVEKKPPLAYVYLNRPGKLNAMHPPAWWEMPAIMDDLDKDPEIRVVIIAGKGKCFSAGIDLPGMATAMPELLSKDQTGSVKLSLLQTIYKLQKTNTCIERCRKPVIAAIHGFCIGAGLDMATACDIRLCSRDAQFSLREAAVAFVADVGVESSAGPGSVQFLIIADDELRAKSPVLKQGEVYHLYAELANATHIILRVLNGGDGYSCDHAAWGSARFLKTGITDPLARPAAAP